MRMRANFFVTSAVCTLLLVGCSHQQSETLESSDTVKVHTKSESSQNGSSSSKASSSVASSDSSSTVNGQQSSSITNKLATEAIKKIETKKGVILDESFVIIVQSQSDDVIEINVRKKTADEDVTTSYGFFKYTKSTSTLEQRNDENAAYEEVQ